MLQQHLQINQPESDFSLTNLTFTAVPYSSIAIGTLRERTTNMGMPARKLEFEEVTVEDRLTKLESNVERLQSDVSELKGDVGRLDAKIDTKFDEVNRKFDTKFDEMNRKFDAQKNSVDAKFDAQKDSVAAKFDMLRDSVDAKFDAQKDSVAAKFDMLRDSVDGKFDQVNRKLDTLTDSIAAQSVSNQKGLLKLVVWAFTLYIALAGGLVTAMAHGFHWL
jgi:chromosome segregation ATPase